MWPDGPAMQLSVNVGPKEMRMGKQAFVLRIAPGGIDKVPDALESSQIIIGWSEAQEVLDPNLSWEQFR